jgi:hypothetical protein
LAKLHGVRRADRNRSSCRPVRHSALSMLYVARGVPVVDGTFGIKAAVPSSSSRR